MDTKRHTDDEIYSLIAFMRTADMFTRYMELHQRKMGHSSTRFGLLMALLNHGGEMTPTALSKLLFRTQHSVTSLVHTLQYKGFVETVVNPADGRSRLIRLTEKGRVGISSCVPRLADVARTAFACLSQDDLANLNAIMRRMRKHLYRLLEESYTPTKEKPGNGTN
ncbi:MAG: MarR family winged helix-turn-helix transcriptional regulator [Dehalococcoidales bacterium]|nr:MarR family winged helix-turn-helix transcriptional regulator [Dehalococcoidales bacterium]